MTRIITLEPGATGFGVTSGPQFGVPFTVVGPDGTRAVFNNPADPDYVGFLTDVSGLDSAEVRENAEVVAGDDGGIHGDFFYGRRPIVFEGMIDNRPGTNHWAYGNYTEVARNLVPNPGMEYDSGLTGWTRDTGTTSAMTRVSTNKHSGTYAMQLTRIAGSTGDVWASTSLTSRFTVTPGSQWTASMWTYGASNPKIDIDWYNAAGSVIGSSIAAPTGVATTSWQRTTVTASAPASAVSAVAWVGAGGVLASGTILADDVLFQAGSLTDYFDGTTYPATGGLYLSSWAGVAHQSQSILYSGQEVPLSSNVVRNLRATKLQRAFNAMRRDTSIRWTPEGGIEQQITVRRQQPLRITGAFNKTFQAAVVAADYRIYSAALKEQRFSPNVSGVLTTLGSTSTMPVITINGPVTNPDIRNQSNGGITKLTYTLTSGNSIVIDYEAKTIKLNGTTNIYSAMDFPTSNWWELDPGPNTLLLNGTGTGNMLVSWNDAWV